VYISRCRATPAPSLPGPACVQFGTDSSAQLAYQRVERGGTKFRAGGCAAFHAPAVSPVGGYRYPPDAEFAAEVESRRGVFHQACFNLWRDIVAKLRAQES
jgi:hypothetical protein